MLNKVSYLSKSASVLFAIVLIGMIEHADNSQSKMASPGPHMDRILFV